MSFQKQLSKRTMVAEQRRRSTETLSSQNVGLSESKIHGRRRLQRQSNSCPRRPFPVDVVFFSVAVLLVIAYGVLSSAVVSVTEEQDHQTHERVLYQVIADTEILFDTAVPKALLPQRPRTVGYYFGDGFIGTERLDPNTVRLYDSRGVPDISARAIRKQKELLDSEDYLRGRADPFEVDDCVAQHEWQTSYYPTCNNVLEQDMTNAWQNSTAYGEHLSFLAHGYFRDVWSMKDSLDEVIVMKTLRFRHDYTERNFDRHRRDALAMERLTGQLYILDIYSFCGNTGLFEFASGGSLENSIYYRADDEEQWSPEEKLMVAHQVASGINAVHHFEKDGIPAIAHTDITGTQCRFLAWNKKTNKACGYTVGSNPGVFRSPEEYDYDVQTEKVDVYSVGNLFYGLLTGMFPFEIEKLSSKEVKRAVRRGKRPKIDGSYKNSTNPYTQALVKSISMCWIQDPEVRVSAAKLLEFITSELTRLKANSKKKSQ
eukprot:scaffold154_cov129-Cylindrotheca_fusiformis.AAC.9